MTQDQTKTSTFILPIINLQLRSELIDSYLGVDSSPEDFGKSIYIEVANLSEELVRPDIDEIIDLGGTYLLKYTFTEKEYQTFVYPFIHGKYSKMNKEYTRTFFPLYEFFDGAAHPSLFQKIFDRCSTLKEHWEKRLGVTLNSKAEVWTKMLELENTFYFNQK
jgi:hypothetical protein